MSSSDAYLSKRYQQIMDCAYRLGEFNVADLETAMTDAPANATLRTQLRHLVAKGHLSSEEREGKYFYRPVRQRPNVAQEVMQRFLKNFASDSVSGAFATLLSAKEADLTNAELDELQALLDAAKARSAR